MLHTPTSKTPCSHNQPVLPSALPATISSLLAPTFGTRPDSFTALRHGLSSLTIQASFPPPLQTLSIPPGPCLYDKSDTNLIIPYPPFFTPSLCCLFPNIPTRNISSDSINVIPTFVTSSISTCASSLPPTTLHYLTPTPTLSPRCPPLPIFHLFRPIVHYRPTPATTTTSSTTTSLHLPPPLLVTFLQCEFIYVFFFVPFLMACLLTIRASAPIAHPLVLLRHTQITHHGRSAEP